MCALKESSSNLRCWIDDRSLNPHDGARDFALLARGARPSRRVEPVLRVANSCLVKNASATGIDAIYPMALKQNLPHNQVLAYEKRSTHANQEQDLTEPSLKRLKSEHVSDSDSIQDEWITEDTPHVTGVESCLAPVSTDQESIDEYESSQARQEISGEALNRLDQRRWVQGRSSIYVDAFNLALETVLDEESHLFNEVERALFGFWKNLSYGAQYL